MQLNFISSKPMNPKFYKYRKTHLELIRCCRRNDLTTGLLSIPNLGNGEKGFVPSNSSPTAYCMSISNTSGSSFWLSSPKQNTETMSTKNPLQRWRNCWWPSKLSLQWQMLDYQLLRWLIRFQQNEWNMDETGWK